LRGASGIGEWGASGSFDCAACDEAASDFAQDDGLLGELGEQEQQRDLPLRGGGQAWEDGVSGFYSSHSEDQYLRTCCPMRRHGHEILFQFRHQ